MASPTTHRPPLRADALLLLVTWLAATGWIFSQQALKGLPPLLSWACASRRPA